jgi:HD-GYP domain-containing protein (c-di-GMP phosphodiesterase class II)
MAAVICALMMRKGRLLVHWVNHGGTTQWLSPAPADSPRLVEALGATMDAYRKKARAEHRARLEAKRVVEALAVAVDAKDHYTHCHSQRVAAWTRELAIEMDLEPASVASLVVAGRLHDVGKIAVPDAVLLKKGRFTPAEYEAIKAHSAAGERIVHDIGLTEIAPWIRHHHERWDGRGYPDGVAGEDIPIASRILAAADSLDAMTQDRSYQRTLSWPEAIMEIRANRGTQFDPQVADALVDILVRREAAGENQVPEQAASDSAWEELRLVPAR